MKMPQRAQRPPMSLPGKVEGDNSPYLEIPVLCQAGNDQRLKINANMNMNLQYIEGMI